MTLPLVLASGSRYRAALLKQLQLEFSQASPDIDETPLSGETAEDYVNRLAAEKARALSTVYPSHWIIGSDQTCLLDGKITGKPGTSEKALEQLRSVQGRRVTFLTGLCLYNSQTGAQYQMVEPFHVHFRTLTDEELRHYINIERPLDCAGSFKVEGLGINLFSALEGRDANSLIGLPLIGLCDLMRQAGLNPLLLAR